MLSPADAPFTGVAFRYPPTSSTRNASRTSARAQPLSDRKGIDLTWEERTITNLSVSRLAPYPLSTRFPRRMIVIRQIRRERDSRVENSGLRRVLPGKSPAPHLSLENTPATTVLERADISLEATRVTCSSRFVGRGRSGDAEVQILLPQNGCYCAATVIENFLTPH